MYTSGCPKNQNKCWYKIGSPPPIGSKNPVLIFRSVNSIVIPPARTGKEPRSKTAVTKTDQGYMGIWIKSIPVVRKFIIVVIKFIAPILKKIPLLNEA